jgi:hypothetical protein
VVVMLLLVRSDFQKLNGIRAIFPFRAVNKAKGAVSPLVRRSAV